MQTFSWKQGYHWSRTRTDIKDQTDASQTLPSAVYEAIYEVINGMTTQQLAYRCWTLTPAIKAASTSQRCMCAQSWQDKKYKHGFFYQLVSIHLKTKPRFTRRSENINGRYLKKITESLCSQSRYAGISSQG